MNSTFFSLTRALPFNLARILPHEGQATSSVGGISQFWPNASHMELLFGHLDKPSEPPRAFNASAT